MGVVVRGLSINPRTLKRKLLINPHNNMSIIQHIKENEERRKTPELEAYCKGFITASIIFLTALIYLSVIDVIL